MVPARFGWFAYGRGGRAGRNSSAPSSLAPRLTAATARFAAIIYP